MRRLFCFGLGYSALELVTSIDHGEWSVTGTVRYSEKVSTLKNKNIEAFAISDIGASSLRGKSGIPGNSNPHTPELMANLALATHVLISIAPDGTGDPVLAVYRELLEHAEDIRWIGYLSTIGVYGNHDGAWVDEETPPNPVSKRSRNRVKAEKEWLKFGRDTGKPVQIFRLSGIYGPGRSPLEKLRQGTARRIEKPGQIFNRIHVHDIARILILSMDQPRSGAVYNVTDDEPAPPQDVVAYAAELLNLPSPPLVPFEEADLTPMGRSFYGENKRVSNALIKGELGFRLTYPTYREGLKALASEK